MTKYLSELKTTSQPLIAKSTKAKD